jgi:malonate transporter
MDVPCVILPDFAVIVTGWPAGASGYFPQPISSQTVRFSCNVAMPALVSRTIMKSPRDAPLDWRFLAVSRGAAAISFLAFVGIAFIGMRRGLASSAMAGIGGKVTVTAGTDLEVVTELIDASTKSRRR